MAEQQGEGELLAALRRGDQDAFALMVERYSGTVYNLALRLMDNVQEAEEVLQETFLNAYRALDRFEGRSLLGTWLYRIAYNAALVRLRRRQPAGQSLDEADMDESGQLVPRQLVDWSAQPDAEVLSGELRSVLGKAVSALSPPLRAVFVLRDIEGESTAATAAALGLTETNVKVRLHRARLLLREALSAYFAASGGPERRPSQHSGEARQEVVTGGV